jgi:hypothetical protein
MITLPFKLPVASQGTPLREVATAMINCLQAPVET